MISWRDEDSTLKQRVSLTNMHQALGWPVNGIRDMKKGEASDAIDKAKKEIKRRMQEHGTLHEETEEEVIF